jgi:hydrogenase maturation protease
VKKILVAGIGSELLGDDGVGPYVVRMLRANYMFDEGIEVEDLGTPALDLIDHIAGLDALIIVDAVQNGEKSGSVTLYRKRDLPQSSPTLRMDPHSPALADCLWAAEFYGAAPKELLLVGVTADSLDGGCDLSDAVRGSIDRILHEVLREIDRLGGGFIRRFEEGETDIWWRDTPAAVA